MALAAFQLVSPFLVYRALLNSYNKFVLDTSYSPKNITENELMIIQRKRLALKFNKIGIPLLFFSYLAMSQINKDRNAKIVNSIIESI